MYSIYKNIYTYYIHIWYGYAPSGKLTQQWNIPIFNRKYIFKGSILFHFPLLTLLDNDLHWNWDLYTSNLKDCQKESHDVSLTFPRNDMNDYQLTVIQPPSAEGVHLELPVTKGSQKTIIWDSSKKYTGRQSIYTNVCVCVWVSINLLAVWMPL